MKVDTINFAPHQVLKVKDVMTLMYVCERTARSYLSDIREAFNITTVTYHHYCKYFQI